jgi:predicted PurR-regulated permease PerM
MEDTVAAPVMGLGMRDTEAGTSLLKRGLLAGTSCALAILCVLVLRPFLAPLLWAAILAYVTWPLYRRLRLPLKGYDSAAASLMTLLVVIVAVVPVVFLVVLIQHELLDAYRSLTTYFSQGPRPLPAVIRDVPWLGAWLQNAVDRYGADPGAFSREITADLQSWKGELGAMLGGVGRNAGKLVISVLTLFFFYRDGDLLVRQTQRVGRRFFDDRLDRYLRGAGVMTRAVVYGLLVTAVAQGVIAGVGYWIFGVEAPAVFGVLTGLLSTAPVLGTAFVWGPLGAGLLMEGHTWRGLLLLAWGVLLVHPTDNVLRPLFISSVTRVPFLVVMFGALGGLLAFGLVGVVLGPVLLGIATSVWREWAAEDG